MEQEDETSLCISVQNFFLEQDSYVGNDIRISKVGYRKAMFVRSPERELPVQLFSFFGLRAYGYGSDAHGLAERGSTISMDD